MNFSHSLIFVAIIVVLTKQSDAGTIGSAETNRSLEEALFEGKQHKAYDETKLNLQQQASAANDNEANQIILNRLTQLIYYTRLSADSAYDVFNETFNTLSSSSEVIVQNLDKAFDRSNMDVVKGGGFIYLGIGAATHLLEQNKSQVLNEALQILTEAGSTAIAGYSSARKLSTQGASAGKTILIQALLAACRSVQTTEKAIYNLIIKGAKRAYDAVDNKSMSKEENAQDNLAKEQAAARNAKCQDAIESIEKSTKTASSKVTSKSKLQAIQVVRDGLIEALKTIAKAVLSSYKALDEAKEIKNQEQTQVTVEKGFASSKNEGLVAGAIAQQALGAAAFIVGQEVEEAIVQAMTIIDSSRVALLDGLESSQRIVSLGIKNNVSGIALTAGREGVETAEYSVYDIITNSAKSAINTIVSA